jgi:hypothetical protein
MTRYWRCGTFEMRTTDKISVRKPKGKRLLGHRWEDNTKLDLTVTESDDIASIHLTVDSNQWWTIRNIGSKKGRRLSIELVSFTTNHSYQFYAQTVKGNALLESK